VELKIVSVEEDQHTRDLKLFISCLTPNGRNFLTMVGANTPYSSIEETKAIFELLFSLYPDDVISLPPEIRELRNNVRFKSARDSPYFPVPFKETETGAALKAIEGSLAAALADLKAGGQRSDRNVTIDLEKTTAFLFQAYLATVDGLEKLDPAVKAKLKGMEHVENRSILSSFLTLNFAA
jgi:hypothetical protein